MRTKLAKKFTKLFTIVLAVVAFAGCKPSAERLYSEAYAEIEKRHFRIAVDLLEKSSELERSNVVKYKYLTEAARVARFEIQDYERAVRLYRKVVLSSESEIQRLGAEEAIAEIYLENIQNYTLALKELQTIEPLVKDEEKKEKIKLKIVLALYLTGNYSQAIEEINSSIKTTKKETLSFLKIKAQSLVAEKNFKEAIEIYEEIRKRDEKFFEDENLFIATSVVYEESEDYAEALNYLTRFGSHIKDKAYLDLRTKRLKERIVNKPLFKGKRK